MRNKVVSSLLFLRDDFFRSFLSLSLSLSLPPSLYSLYSLYLVSMMV